MNMWIVFAILSAVFAALTSILAKVGIEGVDSNLATAVRTVVVVIMAWAMVFITNAQSGLSQISRKSWIFLILSGIATKLLKACLEEMKKHGIKGVNLITQGDGFLPEFYEKHGFKKENEVILMGMEL